MNNLLKIQIISVLIHVLRMVINNFTNFQENSVVKSHAMNYQLMIKSITIIMLLKTKFNALQHVQLNIVTYKLILVLKVVLVIMFIHSQLKKVNNQFVIINVNTQ